MDEETVRTLTVAAKFIALLTLLNSGRVVVIPVALGWLITVYHRLKGGLA